MWLSFCRLIESIHDQRERFFRKMLKDEPLLSPEKIGTDGANTFPFAIKASVDSGLLRGGLGPLLHEGTVPSSYAA